MEELWCDDFALVTQNVDGLHERAGSRRVHRLHGSIWNMRCTADGRKLENREVPLRELPPRCECGAMLRPDVVWFGEMLESSILNAAFLAAEKARTVLVIGTSSLVYPAAALPLIALEHGAHVVEFNPEATPLTELASEYVQGPAALTLPDWWKENRPI
ncbi:MAG: Sir2 family NAD-dependent protein deacetylase [Candidatus Eisenbacteria bacterium]